MSHCIPSASFCLKEAFKLVYNILSCDYNELGFYMMIMEVSYGYHGSNANEKVHKNHLVS